MHALSLLLLAASATAQSVSFVYTATFTQTAFEYVTFTTCPCSTTTTTFMTTTSTPVSTLTTTTSASRPLLPSSDTIVQSSPITTATSPAATSSNPAASSITSTAGLPIVTNEAYIDAILLHHNIHRANHTAQPVVWSTDMADIARQIASTCVYGHVTNVNGGGYGQNIGTGYPATPLGMGQFITEGLYNSEVNNYIYYGGEPDTSTLNQWGHFSQIVWQNTGSVGCYTQDCSTVGLTNAGPPIPPFFTVCNYSPPGNVLGSFAANVLEPIGLAPVFGDYGLS